MILIHSNKTTPCEIERFFHAWRGSAPLAVVPNAQHQGDHLPQLCHKGCHDGHAEYFSAYHCR
ncbi:hypothetical protein QA636_34315 [Bradyrhizobium brasilense]|uniref:Uncharacterized protein n=1 Tax=Bradyrhizobium brasilense TaxID=1419277 RepID=A0ABY8JD23_9BRAD|nr:hypothetical protein [Bradyrhizobium brasilense]WFU62516.1 hypothetical protein QA636_34315 [Bradyrhizobium brasilense]